jgi:uncharacterized membrane protein
MQFLRAVAAAAVLFALCLLAASPHALAATTLRSNCAGCGASGQEMDVKGEAQPSPMGSAQVEVDPTSYKLWPSGSRTFLNVVWGSAAGQASFEVRNSGTAPSSPFTARVDVSNHNPLTQTPVDDMTLSYAIPSLDPGATTEVTVPLDPTQCDIFVSVDLGTGSPIVLRTGNPATC